MTVSYGFENGHHKCTDYFESFIKIRLTSTYFCLEAVLQRCSVKKVFYRSESCNFIKNETMAQVFSCEFCEISKNTSFYRTPLVAASVSCIFLKFENKYVIQERKQEDFRAGKISWNKSIWLNISSKKERYCFS